MKVHILGICGTFMGGVALLARASGFTVSGSDENVYPPMSTLLAAQKIDVKSGFDLRHIEDIAESEDNQIIIGNVMSRGKEVVEYTLNQNISYTSGPQWLYENILKDKWVLAVSGTHGKTTTASILAWILEYAGLNPGFLIGGVPENFGISARLCDSPFFVVEADEYDTAFFDKRSKFVHYHPKTLVMNNLEFDHADIFDNLEAIQTQFHHLIRLIPQKGLIIANADEPNIHTVLDKGCWTPVEPFSSMDTSVQPEIIEGTEDHTKPKGWNARYLKSDGSEFEVLFGGVSEGSVKWSLLGRHNISNALAAVAAARHAGVSIKLALEALEHFKGIKRRMELKGKVDGVSVYDDFAHHPTAIETTLKGLRENVGDSKIIAVLEPRSNTMRLGIHKETLARSLAGANQVCLFQPKGLDWDMDHVLDALPGKSSLHDDIDHLVTLLSDQAKRGDHFLIMSNGGFGGIHEKLLSALKAKQSN